MADETELPLRIVVEQAPKGVSFAVQLGRKELLPPVHRRGRDLVFELQLRIKRGVDGQIVFLGSAAQGPPHDRFVYLNSGTMAGQADSPWTRRAKVKLAGIDSRLAAQTLSRPGARLEARIAGTGRDGGPSCATVPLQGSGWQIIG
jgi:hypothetical protein